MSSPTDQRIDPHTDQRIDPSSPTRHGSSIGPPSRATVAEVHVSRLIINADQVETKTVPRQGAGESRRPSEPPQWSKPSHQRRHSASELTAIAVIPIAETPQQQIMSRPLNHMSRPPDHMSRPPDHMSRPPDHMSRPPDHMSRPPDHISRPPDHMSRPPDHMSRSPDHMSRPPDHMSRPPDHNRRRLCADQQVRRLRLDTPRTSSDRLQSRCCWTCLIFPILLAISFMGVGLFTFSVMDYKVKKSCTSPIVCSISCYNNSDSTFSDCGVVYAGGGLGLLISAIFVLSLAIRICHGIKVLTGCVVCELFLHLLNLATAATVSATLNLDIDYSTSCLQRKCGNSLDMLDVTSFMEQAQVGVWLTLATTMLTVFLWILLGLKTCFNFSCNQRQPQGERQRLLDT